MQGLTADTLLLMEQVDLGVCDGVLIRNDPRRAAVILPGAFYVPAAPLLWFAGNVLDTAGWTVLQVWDRRRDNSDPERWVAERFDAALSHIGNPDTILVVAKSITTLAAERAAELGLPGIWLTPLLNQSVVRSGLEAAAATRLLAGGTADPTWDSGYAATLDNATIVEIPGADHGLQFPGDHHASLDALRTVTDAIADFAARLT